MTDLYSALLVAGFATAAVTFAFLLYFTAPYGRHIRQGWGPTVPNRWGWIAMETPAVLAIAIFYATAAPRIVAVPLIFLGLWQAHYIYRTFIFPFMLKTGNKRMPLLIVVSGMAFNVFNGYTNGRYLGWNAAAYEWSWLHDPRFVLGAVLFVSGFAINVASDRALIALRHENDGGYAIPTGGFFRWVSCPNYMGECVAWIGWAMLTWSPAGALFAVWTAANLVPRALANHRWYRERFPEYPQERKAVFPYLV